MESALRPMFQSRENFYYREFFSTLKGSGSANLDLIANFHLLIQHDEKIKSSLEQKLLREI